MCDTPLEYHLSSSQACADQLLEVVLNGGKLR